MRHPEITDSKAWNAFVSENGPRSGAFLHSWEWGVFRERLGESVHREGFLTIGNLDTVALMIEKRLPLGFTYLTCPRGPIVRRGGSPSELLAIIRKAGKEAGALFFRFEPPIENAEELTGEGVKKSIEIHPAHTMVQDLRKTEAELLAGMHHKTRYNIRLAERKGVTVEIGAVLAMGDVWPIFEKTASRGDFHLHPKSYYEKMLASLGGEGCRAFLAVARFEGEIIAANIMIDFAGVRTYLHGASDHNKRELMAPYLLHFELIKEAKSLGLDSYDWWGVAPLQDSPPSQGGARGGPHPWAGITRFKEGFGGERIAYPGTYDLILRSTSYTLYTAARNLLRKMR